MFAITERGLPHVNERRMRPSKTFEDHMTAAQAATQIQRPPKRDLLGPEVGRRIKAARTKRGMSLAQLGGDELSRSFLSLVESGKSRISLRALAIVADRLETPIGDFLEDEDAARASELLLDYSEIELESGKPEEALRIIRGGATQYVSDPRAQWLHGRALIGVKDHQQATAVLREALQLVDETVDKTLAAEILYSLGRSLYVTDNYDEAKRHLHKGLELALEEPENPGLQARLFIMVGHTLYVLNKPDEALAHYARAQEVLGSLYELEKVGAVYSAMSLAARKKGNLEAALTYSKQSVATYRLRRDWKQVARELNNVAMRHLESGDLERARERAQESVQRAQEVEAPDVEAHSRGTLALVCLQQGNIEEAQQQAALAEALASDESPLAKIDAWMVMADIAALSENWERVDQLYRGALDVLRKLDHKSRLADTALRYSLQLRKRGDLSAALDLAVEAAESKGGRVA
jgi:tetratricopeptide (TPR) repeat protein